MSIVILTGNGPEHRYVTNVVCAAVAVDRIVVDVTERRPALKRAFRGGKREGVARVALFAFRRIVKDSDARAKALRAVLAERSLHFDEPDKIVEVHGINSPEAHAAVTAVNPGAIVVYGTAIVRDEMLAHARDLAFNMHTGLSPQYRGTDCAFWPIVNGEPEQLGATVHECTSAVDGGQVFLQGGAALEPGDGVHAAFARVVVRGAGIYAEVLERYVAGQVSGWAQDLSTGREYRGNMRTLRPELKARWNLLRLRRAGTSRTTRVPPDPPVHHPVS